MTSHVKANLKVTMTSPSPPLRLHGFQFNGKNPTPPLPPAQKGASIDARWRITADYQSIINKRRARCGELLTRLRQGCQIFSHTERLRECLIRGEGGCGYN